MSETTPEADPRRRAEEARDRVHFEEEALELADQVYRVARRLVSTREAAEDFMQETDAPPFRPSPGAAGRPVPPTSSRSRKATTTSTTGSRSRAVRRTSTRSGWTTGSP